MIQGSVCASSLLLLALFSASSLAIDVSRPPAVADDAGRALVSPVDDSRSPSEHLGRSEVEVLGREMRAFASADMRHNDLFSTLRSLVEELGTGMEGRAPAKRGETWLAVRQLAQVSGAIVFLLNALNPCQPVGVMDCKALCPPCAGAWHVLSRVCRAVRALGQTCLVSTRRAVVWALQHVPYLQQLSAEEERTRRRARLHKLQAANAKAQLEVARQRARLQDARHTLDQLSQLLQRADKAALQELGPDTGSSSDSAGEAPELSGVA